MLKLQHLPLPIRAYHLQFFNYLQKPSLFSVYADAYKNQFAEHDENSLILHKFAFALSRVTLLHPAQFKVTSIHQKFARTPKIKPRLGCGTLSLRTDVAKRIS